MVVLVVYVLLCVHVFVVLKGRAPVPPLWDDSEHPEQPVLRSGCEYAWWMSAGMWMVHTGGQLRACLVTPACQVVAAGTL